MEIEQDLMQTVHKAKDQLYIGLENYDRGELKEMLNFLISLEISFYKNFVKPYFDAIKELDDEDPKVLPLPEETPSE